MSIDVQSLKKFTFDDNVWTLVWTNKISPSMYSDGDIFEFYNDGEWRGTSLYFYKDIELGRKKRIVISQDSNNFVVSVYINTSPNYYDDWELIKETTIQPKELMKN